ncbi:MAG: phenylacetate-CoA oxygenase subunit PaaJ [Schleiferiaceae bacterium]|jgi:ring-1,2-phenylacetyl-CoA epoxidase subunit PaaD|nr:phenylacetate-CoA oxygenase subunit PaaJ [Schleiferiaceae bacterium]
MKTVEEIYTLLDEVKDPEIPVLTVNDMGIIRDVQWNEDELTVTITPTYTGCPAMDLIESQIKEELEKHNMHNVKVATTLSPPWSTDWISEDGLKKLEEFGIAPPVKGTADKRELFAEAPKPRCPYCKSEDTQMISAFGSTACKSQYKCNSCLEPFDYFKCI